jgi:hypothetical protein
MLSVSVSSPCQTIEVVVMVRGHNSGAVLLVLPIMMMMSDY